MIPNSLHLVTHVQCIAINHYTNIHYVLYKAAFTPTLVLFATVGIHESQLQSVAITVEWKR